MTTRRYYALHVVAFLVVVALVVSPGFTDGQLRQAILIVGYGVAIGAHYAFFVRWLQRERDKAIVRVYLNGLIRRDVQ